MARDPFATQGELGSDFVGTISKAEAITGQYGPQVVVTVKLDEAIVKNDGTLLMEMPIYVRLGAGWKASADGDLLVHDSGDADKVMDGRAQYGKWIERARDLGGPVQAAMIANSPDGPYRVSAWQGLRFHFMSEGGGRDFAFTNDAGEKITGKSRPMTMPAEYLGTTGAPAASNGQTAAPMTDEAVEALGLPTDVLSVLIDLAKTHTYGAWVNEALKFRDESPGLMAALGDDELYRTLQVR